MVQLPSRKGNLPEIEVFEDKEHQGLVSYSPNPKIGENIVTIHGDEVYTYCTICDKYISNDSSNIHKHQRARHLKDPTEDTKIKLMRLLIELNAPLSIAEKQYFRDIFPNFVKDRKSMKLNYKQLYKITKANVKHYLSKRENLNLYIDEWTRFGLNFIGIFCSTEEKDALLTCGIPKETSRDAFSISNFLVKQMRYFNILDRINFCSSDCAKNVSNAILNLNLTWFPCCCHIVNKALEKALQKIPQIHEIHQKVSQLTSSTKLREYLISNNATFWTIPKFSQTRWLSIGNMFKRLQNQKHIIQKYINSSLNIHNVFFSDYEWVVIDIFADIIGSINESIMELESMNKSGFFYALIKLLKIVQKDAMQMRTNGFNAAYQILQNYIIEKLKSEQEWTTHLFIAAVLNPNIDIEEEGIIPDEILEYKRIAYHKILEKIPAIQVENQTPNNFGMRKPNMDQNQYQLFRNLPYPGNIDLINFWKSHSVDLPDLYNIAKQYFGLYPSSSCIERTFSMAKNVLAEKYGAISPKMAEKRIFLYVNNDFMHFNE